MAKLEEEKYIKIKFGLAFSKLLADNKRDKENNLENGIVDMELNYTLGKISIDTGLRVATLSDIFSGKSNPKAVTIVMILISLGKTLSDLASYYDSLTENEIKDHMNKLGKTSGHNKKK